MASTSCTQERNDMTLFNKAKLLAVYVEANNEKDGLSSGSFGDLVLMNLTSGESLKLTNDGFYDTKPCFSPDGKYILFQSNRIGEKLYLDVKGISGPFDIFIYDLEKCKISQIDIPYQTNRPREYRESIRDMDWMPEGKNLFFKLLKNEIYLYNIESKTTKLLRKITEFPMIDNLSVSAKNIFAFSFRQTLDNLDNAGLALFDVTKDSIIIFNYYSNTFGPWNNIGDRLLYWGNNRTIYVYDYLKNEKKELFPIANDLLIYKNLFQNEEDVILLCGLYRKADSVIYEPKQVVIYNLKTKKYNWLTDTNLEKDWMDVYIRE
ncbi:MAG: hypothetical protein OEM46_04215 [Ignavibacteria bacterium]|nr:hypothetical protein [Ignavibacteria bacterium]